MQKLFRAAAILFFVAATVQAQSADWFSISSGLNIRAITEESGFLWVCTESGFAKFNKTTGEKTLFNKTNSGLRSNFLTSVVIDNNGNKWIGSRETGLYKFDGTTFTNFNTTNSTLPVDNIQGLAKDASGTLWIATYGGGLVKYKNNVFTAYDSISANKPINYLYTVACDNFGFIWLGTGGDGMVRYDGESEWVLYSTSNNNILKSDVVRTIVVDSNGDKWIGTESGDGGGLYKWNGSQFTLYSTGSFSLNIYGISFDPQGKVWVSSYGGGLAKLEGNSFTVYNKTNSGLPDNGLKSLYIDAQGVKWIGSERNGLVKYNDVSFTKYNLGVLPNIYVFSMATDPQGNKWIGTKNYLTKYASGVVEDIKLDDFLTVTTPGFPANFNVWAIAFDQSGNKWIGTYDGGLVRFSPSNVPRVFNKSNSQMPSNDVYSVLVDKNNIVWIGTSAGLVKYDGTLFTVYNSTNSPLPNNYCASMVIDKSNRLWIATTNGVARFDGVNWSVYTTATGLASNYTFSVTVDSNNNKWIGTGAGLSKYDGSTWTTYTTGNSGLPSNTVQFVKADQFGNIWCGTGGYAVGYGLTKFNGTNWSNYNRQNSGIAGDQVSSFFVDDRGNNWIGLFDAGVCVFKEGGLSDVKDNVTPDAFTMNANYPNPFNPSTMVSFVMPGAAEVTMRIYNNLGKEVVPAETIYASSGINNKSVVLSQLPSGVYYCRLSSMYGSKTIKMMLMK